MALAAGSTAFVASCIAADNTLLAAAGQPPLSDVDIGGTITNNLLNKQTHWASVYSAIVAAFTVNAEVLPATMTTPAIAATPFPPTPILGVGKIS